METTPATSRSSVRTGRCRILRSVMTAMHSSIGVSGLTYTRGVDMMSRTGVVRSSRPWSVTRRR